MLPADLPPWVESSAERRLFVAMRDELSNDWTVMHSLGLTIHDRKPWAEVDFVLIGPPGVFCLEAKGGLIGRVEGVWYTTPQHGKRAGRREELKESPFAQVGSASAQLFKYLSDRLPRVGGAITGYAVATPDCEWTPTGPDLDRALVYDDKDALTGFEVFMRRVAARWSEKVGRGWNRDLELLQRSDKQAIVDLLRGDFSLVPSLRAGLENASESLVRLTAEQAELFSRLSRNPRVIGRGGAGTGKTLLAVAEARRLASSGQRVLLTCFSRNLAHHVSGLLADCPDVTVRTLHSLMAELVSNAARKSELPDAEEADLFEVFYPDLAIDVLLSSGGGMFDALIVDEGQDLLTDSHLDVLDLCLVGGFDAGTWRWFMDPNQNIFEGIAALAMERLLKSTAVDWPLTINCRNTIPIASQVAMLSGVPLVESLVTDGPDVEYIWYESVESQRRDVSAHLRRLVHDGLPPARIAILSRRVMAASGVSDGLSGSLPPLVDISRGGIDSAPAEAIRFSTVASFKGLEADIVLLLDVDDLESVGALSSVYVGASRAKVLLVVFLHEGVRSALAEQARKFGAAAFRKDAAVST